MATPCKLMWNDHLVGTVVPTGDDFPNKYGQIDLLTQDETLVAYFRADSAVAKVDPGLSPKGFDDNFVDRLMRGWRLVDQSGAVERISFAPFIDIDDRFISWQQIYPIRFYRLADEYGCFSNFSKHPITIDGTEWRTNEHYFQGQKFAGTEHEEEIRLTASPMVAARMGRARKRPLRADWESVKDDIMRTVVRAKFTQHGKLREILLETGEAEIIEHTANDRYWGDGGDGTGRNMLGKILMEIRDELRRS